MFGSAAVWLQSGVTPVCGWARFGMTARGGKQKEKSRSLTDVWIGGGVAPAWRHAGLWLGAVRDDSEEAESRKKKADPSRMFGSAAVWLQRGVTPVCGWARFGMTAKRRKAERKKQIPHGCLDRRRCGSSVASRRFVAGRGSG